MNDAGIAELNRVLADVGALLVEAQKYTAAGADAEAVAQAARALGVEARGLGRRKAPDLEQTSALCAMATALLGRLHAAIAEARAQPVYRTALSCYDKPNDDALAPLIPQIFATVAPAHTVPTLFAPVAWRGRGRARSAQEMADAVAQFARDGMTAEGDDLTAGADGALRAIIFDSEPPEDEALVLQIDPAKLAAPLFQHADSGTFLVYRPRLRVPFTVHVAEQGDLDVAPPGYAAYRGALVDALRAAGLDVAPDEEPST